MRERTHQRAGTGVDMKLRLPEAHPHTAGRTKLARNDKTSTAGTQEENANRVSDHTGLMYARAAVVLGRPAKKVGASKGRPLYI